MASQQPIDPVAAALDLHLFFNVRKSAMTPEVRERISADIKAVTAMVLKSEYMEDADPEEALKLALEYCSSQMSPKQIATIVNSHNTTHPELKV
ncbi:MAG: hypothetical protein OQJ97_18600 [Rhodospirillales bacterium]|nr:hypothetical protein [Rhodospirillales bacterium]